jgi:hypothetical protein
VRLLERLGTAWRYASGAKLVELLTATPSPGLSGLALTAVGGGPKLGAAGTSPLAGSFKTVSSDGPRGWLGALFGHGVACLSYEIYYLRHHRHLLPSVAASWNNVKDKVELDYSRDTLMTRRFWEWQCPAFDSQSPDFFGHRRGVTASTLRNQIAMIARGEYGGDGGDIYSLVNTASARRLGEDVQGQRPAANVIDWMNWIEARDHHGKGRSILPSKMRLIVNTMNALEPPSYWNNPSRRPLWEARMRDWMWTAQDAVWCVTMMGLHYGTPVNFPSWWVTFAGCWGVLIRPGFPSTRYSAFQIKTGDEHHLSARVKGDRSEWLWFARKVEELAGLPGDPDKCGQQIASDELTAGGVRLHKRHIFDMPTGAGGVGALAPPLRIYDGGWNGYAVGWWAKNTDIHNVWERYVFPAWSAVCSAAAGFAGPEFAAFQTLATTLYTCSTVLMQIGASLANGRGPDLGDVVAAIGTIAELAGVEGIPDDVWEQLRAAEGAFEGFLGGTSDQQRAAASAARAYLAELQKQWPYVDQGLGGLLGAPQNY